MPRTVKSLSFGLFLGILFSTTTQAATYTAASCAESDVAKAVAQATNGDTVVIPSCPSTTPGGSNTWTTNLTITVGITLQGQGIGNTVLIDNVPKGNNTCRGAAPILSFALTGSTNFRITALTVQGDAPDTYVCVPGHINVSGNGTASRIDHISIVNQQTTGIRLGGCIYGVIDHNTINATQFSNSSLGFHQGVVILQGTCGGESPDYGDYNWSIASHFGTVNFMFLENNIFVDPQAVGAGAIDGLQGERVVFRYNTASFAASHGTESGGRWRGMRAFELYNNTFTAIQPDQFAGFYIRSGTGMVWNNTFNDSGSYTYGTFLPVANDRDADAFPPWGPPAGSGNPGTCDGQGPYDNNSGTIYVNSKATSNGPQNGSIGVANTLTDTTQKWTTNQWATGYSLVDVTQGWGAIIMSNTSNSVTIIASAYSQARNIYTGDSYEILYAYPCLDQVGRGVGSPLSNAATPTPYAWPTETQEPVYQWLNTHNGSSYVNITGGSNSPGGYPHIQPNRDFYDYTTSFTGASGVGSGLLSARPSTCTPSVAYWATDTNTLYQCSAPNAWTVYYTPYTYPHPLTLGGGGAPAPPTNLQATPQ